MLGPLILLCFLTGCAEEFIIFHSASGDPLLISRRAYTSKECAQKIKEDGVRMGVSFRYIHVRGSLAGRSLLWPIEQGYACEAAIGTDLQPPAGAYSLRSSFIPRIP